MVEILVHEDKCIGCEQCVGACPFGQLSLNSAGLAKVGDGCTFCGSCVEACPTEAIELVRAQAPATGEADDVESYRGIFVIAEQVDGEVRGVAYELLGEASRLASQLETKVTAVLLGERVHSAAEQLIHHGADQVLLLDDPALRHFNDEVYANLCVELIRQHKPEIVLIGATTYGRSLAPRISSRLDTGLTADCTELSIDKEKRLLLQTRPAFGGNLMATIYCPTRRPQMASVRPKVMKALSRDASRQGQIITPELTIPTAKHTQVLEVVREAAGQSNLAEADIVVAAGKGVGSAANMALVEQLAKALGGVVGATRPVVDAGWCSYSQQIGQTGKTVAPKLYIACGISGAVQHLAGMSSAEVIVAINSDPEAPIFKLAHYGIVGDITEIIPALLTAWDRGTCTCPTINSQETAD